MSRDKATKSYLSLQRQISPPSSLDSIIFDDEARSPAALCALPRRDKVEVTMKTTVLQTILIHA